MDQPAKPFPKGVVEVRDQICEDCPTPCSPRPDSTQPCARCELKRWGTWGACRDTPPPMRGLGDLVAKVANPIAKALHIDPAKCGCKARQEWLNRKVPFKPAR